MWALALAGAVGARPAYAAELEVQVIGLPEPLESAVRAAITVQSYAGRDVGRYELRRALRGAEAQIRRALEPFGYYTPTVARDVARTNGLVVVVFRVDLGAPVIVRRTDVHVPGSAALLDPVASALAAFEPRQGEPLVHATYEASKDRIADALRAMGYIDARPELARVAVSAEDRVADIELAFAPGRRRRFGEVQFSGLQLPEQVVRGYIPWPEGTPYAASALLELQEQLAATGYFSSVSVQPDLENAGPEVVPIDVEVVAAARTAYSAGLFVSTDVGPGGRVGVERRWANRRGHSYSIDLGYASSLARASLSYRIPRPGSSTRALRFGGAYTDEQTDTSRSRNARLVAAETRTGWYGFNRSLGMQYLSGTFEIGEETRSSSLLYADLGLSRRRADDVLIPRRGSSITLGLRAAPFRWVSDARFVQVRADGRVIRAFGDRSRVLVHFATGVMSVDEFDALPPELRFFAGGDRSLRGFGFQAVGETDDSGDVIGGEYLVTAGLELEHYIVKQWGMAVFIDAGDAFRSDPSLNVAAGIGLRWKSPVGVVRLDVARPIRTELDDGWRFHVVIGPDL